jgi:hypothetical protein
MSQNMNQNLLRTRWIVQPSLAYDALCLLNIFTGDPFYTDEHPGLYERWQPRLTGKNLEVFQRVADLIRHDQGIISAALCLIFSGVKPCSLNDLEQAILEPEPLLEAYRASPYFDQDTVELFEQIASDLLMLVRFLKDSPFGIEHRAFLDSAFEEKCRALQTALEQFDIVQRVEFMLGYELGVAEIEVFVLAYTMPHGIKVIGNRFITAAEWSAEITVRVAIHELMHPPFAIDRPELQTALEKLRQDPVLCEHFETHDPAFGYNTWHGYVEENCVRALDQVICEHFGIARDADERWREEDGGMHILAARLTPLLRARETTGEKFEDWLIGQIMDGLL